MSKAEDERAHLLAAGEQTQTRAADRVVRMIPDLAKRFRQMIAALPRTDLPPDELGRARGLIHSFLGGCATVEKDARGRIFARLKLDGRPLLGPAAANFGSGGGIWQLRATLPRKIRRPKLRS